MEIDKLFERLEKAEKELYKIHTTHNETEEELDEVGVSNEEKEIEKKISRLYEEVDEVIGKEITEIEEELDKPHVDEEKSDALMDRLRDLDPYNDMFHLGCANWPNCESEGCGEH